MTMTNEQRAALDRFTTAIRQVYGPRLVAIVMFGSRARGEEQRDSDVDVAVILSDEQLHFWTEKRRMIELAYHALLDANLAIQPLPLSRAHWEQPELHRNPDLVRAIRREGKTLVDVS